MDYFTWPYFYANGLELTTKVHEQYRDDFPVSGDDIARLKAGQRA